MSASHTTSSDSSPYPRDPDDDPRQQVDDPTPEQIAQRSAEIRRRWSDRVKKKRHLRAPMQWSVPHVPVAEIDTRTTN